METQGGSMSGPTGKEQGQPEQEIDQARPEESEGQEGQPRNDPTVFNEDVDETLVGTATEEPRPNPADEIRQRYEDGGKDRPAAEAEREVEEEVQGETTGTQTGQQRAEAAEEVEEDDEEQ